MPNSTTRRGSAGSAVLPAGAAANAASVAKKRCCSCGRVAARSAGLSGSSSARHSAACQRWSGGSAGASAAACSVLRGRVSWPAAQAASQSLR